MKISFDISPGLIASLMSSAIEGGDPVTTGSRGGWCDGIYWKRRTGGRGAWWANAQTFASNFLFDVVEIDDETTGHKTTHRIHKGHVKRGLEIMAIKFPELFAQVLSDNVDAPCADIFLQCTLFGEEKYA